jgi:hypothetical protein
MKPLKQYTAGLMIVLSSLIYLSCKYDLRELEPKPKASFTVTPISGQTNKYLLSSTSENAFRYQWDKGSGKYVEGKATDTVYFPDAGTYKVRLFVFGQTGTDSASRTIQVAADDPAALTPLKILTGNSQKKWKLAPEAGALWVGPTDASATWWANSTGDVTTRSCLFNDEYTFVKDGNQLIFDGKGDIWVDDEGGSPTPAGMPAVGCHANSEIPSQFQAWANNNTFTFDVINNTQLKVVGTGAHLGLYKAATPPLTPAPEPQASVTYDIVSILPTSFVLQLKYDWGMWRFKYVPAQ